MVSSGTTRSVGILGGRGREGKEVGGERPQVRSRAFRTDSTESQSTSAANSERESSNGARLQGVLEESGEIIGSESDRMWPSDQKYVKNRIIFM